MKRLLVLGDLNLDIHAEEPTPTDVGQEVRSVVRAVPGGSAGTFARVAAGLGARVAFVGAVGRDLIGDLLERDLLARGIEPHLTRSDMSTGAVLALFRGGDRSMVCARGANDALDEHDLEPAWFSGLDHLHVSGYAFLSDRQARAARRAIGLAGAAGASISVNAPPAGLIAAFGVGAFLRELRRVTTLFLNRDEGRLVTGIDAPEEIVCALAVIHAEGALTLGRDGALAWLEQERNAASPPAALDVDPTGAGDAYAAAFVVHRLEGDTLGEANRAACAAAHAHLARPSVAAPPS